MAALNGCQPSRMTPERALAAREVELKLDQTEREQMKEEQNAASTAPLERAPLPEGYNGGKAPKDATLTAPDTFKVQFVCSNGNFVVECHRDWAPVAWTGSTTSWSRLFQ